MTIVELLIGLTIVMISFAALASTVIASFSAIRSNENRVVATALANEAIEDMTTMPWGQLGLYEGDTNLPFIEEVGGEPVLVDDAVHDDELVVLLKNDDGVPPHFEDGASVARDGRQFTLTRWVTFVEEDGGSDLKRMVAIVTWDDGARSIRVEGLRAPDPDDLLELQIRSVHVESSNGGEHRVQLRRPLPSGHEDHHNQFKNSDAFDVVVVVGDVKSSLRLSFRDRGGTLRVLTAPDGEENEEVERTFTIAQFAHQFPHGPVPFLVTATSPDGEVASDTTTVRFYQELEVLEPVVRQAGQPDNTIQLGCDFTPTDPMTVEAEVRGMTANEAGPEEALVAQWRTDGQNFAPDPGLPMGQVEATLEGGIYQAEVPPETTFVAGVVYDFRVSADRVVEEDTNYSATHTATLEDVQVNILAECLE